ncbi:NUDIX hydrolase [Labedaea rhizosphaerae]|uniref:NUDIX hydrolase n=1 Tax=Labedaea rhizosphaerae TaxID=598644 RepID=UPI0014152576
MAIAIVVRANEALVVCRNDPESDETAWQFPAGVVKPGMRPRTVAVRETLAETGVHCAVVNELGSRLHPTTQVLCDYVLCRYVTRDAATLTRKRTPLLPGSEQASWVSSYHHSRYFPRCVRR